jgi:SAM-dependent methyltransferase
MLLPFERCIPLLRSPGGKHALEFVDETTLAPGNARGPTYEVVNGRPILVNFESSILDEEETRSSAARSTVERRSYTGLGLAIKRLVSPEKNATKANVSALMDLLRGLPAPRRVLIVGGGTVGQGMQPLYDSPDIEIVAFDIYATPLVQFVADAHEIPLPDSAFDAVVIQAVLEHVLQPAQVVSEISRVLKPRGIVYAETPFMQQVHEGAYDFTRFTESGHRYLFRNFELVSSGASGGPGLQFIWSVDYLVRSIFRSRKAGKIAKLAFFWVQYLDHLIPSSFAVDGASGVYFLGRKAANAAGPKDIVAHYKGAQ